MAPSSSLEARSNFSLWTWKIKISYKFATEGSVKLNCFGKKSRNKYLLASPVSHLSGPAPAVSGWSMLALTKLWPCCGCVELSGWYSGWLVWLPALSTAPHWLTVSQSPGRHRSPHRNFHRGPQSQQTTGETDLTCDATILPLPPVRNIYWRTATTSSSSLALIAISQLLRDQIATSGAECSGKGQSLIRVASLLINYNKRCRANIDQNDKLSFSFSQNTEPIFMSLLTRVLVTIFIISHNTI